MFVWEDFFFMYLVCLFWKACYDEQPAWNVSGSPQQRLRDVTT